MLGIFLLNTRIPINKRVPLSKLYRALTGVLGGAILASYVFYQKGLIWLTICTFLSWGIVLLSGGPIKRTLYWALWKHAVPKRNSWTLSFLCSFVLILFLRFTIFEHSHELFILYAIAINYAYLGSKVLCFNSNCCGINLSWSRNPIPFGWRLQKFEYYCSTIIIVYGFFFYYYSVIEHSIAASMMLFSHGILRLIAGTLRFPKKGIKKFLADKSVYSILVLSLIILVI